MLIEVISSTTREGRFSERVAAWVTGQLADRDDFDVEQIDLREYPLPFFDGVSPARAPREYASPELEQLGRRLDRADGYIVLIAVGLASVSYAVGLLVKSEDAFAPLVNTVVVPLLLLSGIFLPLTLGPGWLQGIARVSPFKYVIGAMRQAYYGQYLNTIVVEGIAVAVGLAVVCLWLGSRVFLRENA